MSSRRAPLAASKTCTCSARQLAWIAVAGGKGRLAGHACGQRLVAISAGDDGVGAEKFRALDAYRQSDVAEHHVLGPDAEQEIAPVRRRQDIHRRRADEARGERGCRPRVKLIRRRRLLDPAVAHQNDLVGHAHGFALVVGDIDHGDAELLLQRADFAPHLGAQLGVEIGQRLVHQADRRLGDDGAAERDALLLAAGQLRRLARQQRLEPEQRGDAGEPAGAIGRRHFAHAQAEQDVLLDRQMRKQRVGLKHHGDAALRRRQLR